MDKMFKRFIAMVLTIVLCFNMLPITSIASETENSGPDVVAPEQEPADSVPETNAAPSYEDVITEEACDDVACNNQDVVEALTAFSQTQTLATDSSLQRYTVLILDASGSMSGTPASVQKQAAVKFCTEVLQSEGTNYVAIVKLATTSVVGCTFTNDLDTLTSYINSLPANSGTDINEALEKADELLDGIADDGSSTIIKNIVLCSDGLPQSGTTSSTGPYTSLQYSSYTYANAAYNTASAIKEKGYFIYTLGFFHSLSGNNLTFGQQFMSDLASEGKYWYVSDAEDLEFVFGEVAEEIKTSAYKFKFAGHLVEADVESTCYYSDGYFLNDARIYDEHLATMSLCFELTSWSRFTGNWNDGSVALSDTNTRWYNAYNLLVNTLGYSNFSLNEFWRDEPEKDSIGVIAASKTNKYDDSTMIALAVRGGGYGQEWASNFTVGKTGEHDGFSEAKDNVLEFLEEYIKANNISGEIKIWLVGYSRAGCVANMVGGELVDGHSLSYVNSIGESVSVTVAQEDLFVYTFEPAKGALEEDTVGDYSNIHNIVNLNDIVPLVAPESWGFARYNIDRWIPSAETDRNYSAKLSKMKSIYSTFKGDTTYKILEYYAQFKVVVNWSKIWPGGDPFIEVKTYSVPSYDVLTESASFLFDDAIGDRATYYYNWQAGVRELFSLLYGGSLADLLGEGISAEEFITKFFNELTAERIIDIVKPMVALNFDSFETRKDKVKSNLFDFIKDVLSDSDLWGTVLFAADFVDSLTELLWNMFEAVLKDLFDKDTHTLQYLMDFIVMISRGALGQAHYPELTLAWMMSQDSYYEKGQTDFSCTNYRIIHINCPVDIQVYRADTNELVAEITGDIPKEISGSSIYAYLNRDGEKIVILPSDMDYNISIFATDDGQMSYTVEEYDLNVSDKARIVSYFDVAITKGDELSAVVPALAESERRATLTNGSSAEYSLTAPDGTPFTPDQDRTGPDAKIQYSVNVSTNNANGTAHANKPWYAPGSYAEVTASPMAGCSFLGWYVNGVLVSEELVYRFLVTENVELTAYFSEIEMYTLSFEVVGNGTVSNEQISVTAGSQIQIEAIPDERAVFVDWTATAGEIEIPSSEKTWFTMPACDVIITATFADKLSSADVGRIAGADRIGTSLGIADQLKKTLGVEKFDNVIVASALNFPDALTGSYLAAVRSAPILLTYDAANARIQQYIEANLKDGGTVYILGGSTAVSTGFETGVRNLGRFNVTRLAGTDRFGTNLKIMEEAGGYDSKPVLIATALNFADSLSASAAGLPMVLVYGSLKPEQKAFLEKTSKNFVIIGGTSAVSASLEAELRAIGSVERLAGAGRYQTSVMVAQTFVPDPDAVVLAYARNFPDGLCGGPLAYALNAPLVLTDNYDPSAADTYVKGIATGFVVGGSSLISDVATRAIFDLSADTPIT